MIPRGSLGIGEEHPVVEDAVRQIVELLPEGWVEAKFRFDALWGYAEGVGRVVKENGDSEIFRGTVSLIARLHDLRNGMYEDGKGTWYGMMIEIGNSGHYSTKYNYNFKPKFNHEPVVATYVEDLQQYPREDVLIPDWLRQLL
ncbi:hypothetical protein [Nocardiopsis chromatogenes]|uniref:hypothetical protein n=1 Tax=Nocardiopsis chromatogenes TaxID=280239 RepID=UPI0012678B2B|nr:hypothetical protein [Nocardiopsis chromatogenes]